MITYNTIIVASWVLFILVWVVFSFGVKRDIRGGGVASLWQRYFLLRFALLALVIFAASRIAMGSAHYTRIYTVVVFVSPLILDWIGALLTVIGILFAIWARVHLGANWSPAPAVKEKHELVTSGPYQFVRHPIYTGLILAALGFALTGTVFGIVVFLIASLIFFLRINREEKIMLELFPNEYPAYQTRTKKLIPFVW